METVKEDGLRMDESAFQEWIQKATVIEQKLWQRFIALSDLLDDMLFEEGTAPYELIRCQSKLPDSDEWIEDETPRPPQLAYFSVAWFTVKVEEMAPQYLAYYNRTRQQLCVSPKAVENDAVILHEMIHLYEGVVNELPLFYHDMLYWALYDDLSKKIEGLDGAIKQHAHLLNESSLYNAGGLHDILFLLKSFDLDIRKGYELGTVFGYGRTKEFAFLKYEKIPESEDDEDDE